VWLLTAVARHQSPATSPVPTSSVSASGERRVVEGPALPELWSGEVWHCAAGWERSEAQKVLLSW
jgi:hypothetical protein